MKPINSRQEERVLKKREYRVSTIQIGDLLEFLDMEGNPFNPSTPLKYRIIRKDGSLLTEGTLEDSKPIPFKGKKTLDFEVIVESYLTAEVKVANESAEASEETTETGQEEEAAQSSERPNVMAGRFKDSEVTEEIA